MFSTKTQAFERSVLTSRLLSNIYFRTSHLRCQQSAMAYLTTCLPDRNLLLILRILVPFQIVFRDGKPRGADCANWFFTYRL